jgi:hypothetical protein
MQYQFRSYFTCFALLLVLYTITGCHSASKEIEPLYEDYKFDTAVIAKLPVYDSLASALMGKYPFLQQHMDTNESYRAYRYLPFSDQKDVFKELHHEIASVLEPIISKLGKDLFRGFDAFSDSTIKVYIRARKSGTIDIEENLSYYPAGSKMLEREFPDKDSILNNYWQYWVRFSKPGSLF